MQKKISESFTLNDNMLFTASRFPDKIALIIEGKPYTYAELLNDSVRLAAAFRERGLGPGDLVAIYMDNTWPSVLSIFASIIIGSRFFVINPQTKSDKLGFLLNNSRARILLTDGHLSGMFLPVLANRETPIPIICSGTLPESASIESFDEVINATTSLSFQEKTTPNNVMTMFYRSDSNGILTSVPYTYEKADSAFNSLIRDLRLTELDRILSVLPFASVLGLCQLLTSIRLGATLVSERSLTYPARVLHRIDENHVTVIPGSPTVFELLLSACRYSKLTFTSVTHLVVYGGSLSAHLIQRLCEVFPNSRLYQRDDFTENSGTKDNAITTRGEQVSSTEIETILKGIPGVLKASVSGVPDSILGELIRANVVVEADSHLNAKSLRAICMTRMENFMVPKEIIISATLSGNP